MQEGSNPCQVKYNIGSNSRNEDNQEYRKDTVVPQSSSAKQKLNVQTLAWALQLTACGAGVKEVLKRQSRRDLQSTQHHLAVFEVMGLHELRLFLVATSEARHGLPTSDLHLRRLRGSVQRHAGKITLLSRSCDTDPNESRRSTTPDNDLVSQNAMRA